MFQCVVVKTNIEGYEIDDHIFVGDGILFLNYRPHMRLHLVKKVKGDNLQMKALKRQGLRGNIQGHLRVDGDLLGYIEKILK